MSFELLRVLRDPKHSERFGSRRTRRTTKDTKASDFIFTFAALNYLLSILVFLLHTGVMEGVEVKPAPAKCQTKTITGARNSTVLSNTGRKQLRHEWPIQYRAATVLSIVQHAASPKSIEVGFHEFAFAENSLISNALLDQPSLGVPIGELLLFPNHFFW